MKRTYTKPTYVRVSDLTFILRALRALHAKPCRQCSSCHGCR